MKTLKRKLIWEKPKVSILSITRFTVGGTQAKTQEKTTGGFSWYDKTS